MIVYLLKILIWFLRNFTKNSATALPGLLLEKYFPKTSKKLLSDFDKVVLITGTNGKTTTTQMICHILDNNQIKYITNKSGSNLVRGILSSIINSNIKFQKNEKLGIFEVEEGSMPRLTKYMKADYIVVTNIFRDQLDAYGEIDKTFQYIKKSIIQSDNPILILNGDESRVYELSEFSENKKFIINLDENLLSKVKIESSSKFNKKKNNSYFITINKININEDLESDFEYIIDKNIYKSSIKAPGIHNVLNAVYSKILIKNLFNENLNSELSNFEAAFGRGEIINLDNKKFQILLAKNPAGFNLNLDLLQNLKNGEEVLIILNDKIADGKDISWIWDIDFDLLKKSSFKNISISGTRAYDMALRIMYDFGITDYKIMNHDFYIEILSNNLNIKIFNNTKDYLEGLLNNNSKKIFVLPTYTAMREFREELSKYTSIKKIYE